MKRLAAILLLISSLCAGQDRQDTIPVYIFADDTTYRPDIWYQVEDPEGDSSRNVHYSNEYYTTLWGWQVGDAYLDMAYQPLEPKYKVLNSQIREKDLLGMALQPPSEEIVVNGDTTIVQNPERLWFQGEPTVAPLDEEPTPTLWKRIATLWHKIMKGGEDATR